MNKIILILLFLQLSVTQYKTGDTYGNAIISRVNRVYDGDTIFVDIDSYPDIIGKDIGVRIAGIDTPEIRGTRGTCVYDMAIEARDYLRERLYDSTTIELRNMYRDKYFRIGADLYADGVNIGTELINKGYAQVYTGQDSRPEWHCEEK